MLWSWAGEAAPARAPSSCLLRSFPTSRSAPSPRQLALGASRHPHPAGPPTPSARATPLTPASCLHLSSLGGVGFCPMGGPEMLWAKTSTLHWGHLIPDRGPWRDWGRAALWGGGVARAWRQDGRQDRPPTPTWGVQARQGYGLLGTGWALRVPPQDPQSLAVPGQPPPPPKCCGSRACSQGWGAKWMSASRIRVPSHPGLDGGGLEGESAGPGQRRGTDSRCGHKWDLSAGGSPGGWELYRQICLKFRVQEGLDWAPSTPDLEAETGTPPMLPASRWGDCGSTSHCLRPLLPPPPLAYCAELRRTTLGQQGSSWTSSVQRMQKD